eukprot:gene46537-8763_t
MGLRHFLEQHKLAKWYQMLCDSGVCTQLDLGDATAADDLPKCIPVGVRRKLWLEYAKGRLP